MAKDKIKVVMGEFKRGTLKSGSGEKVTDRKQAQAIALSERRKQGGKMPSYYDSKSSKPKKGKVKKYGSGGRFGEEAKQAQIREARRQKPHQYDPGYRPRKSAAEAENHEANRLRNQKAKNPSITNEKMMEGLKKKYGKAKLNLFKEGGSVNQLIDKKYGHGGLIRHNPSDINP
ncbi:MAG: hypothetical protein GOVbin152_64 [Prokaryotic dsDNA virus sp.]|nr:MAG: hypothetical protein GOVbin152_64 [Prokaryotic dsDNA virus sp.]|tara:strand:+ start:178 stop:699 length:522 start_codon:yes stop_codon:yes gene_type:complete